MRQRKLAIRLTAPRCSEASFLIIILRSSCLLLYADPIALAADQTKSTTMPQTTQIHLSRATKKPQLSRKRNGASGSEPWLALLEVDRYCIDLLRKTTIIGGEKVASFGRGKSTQGWSARKYPPWIFFLLLSSRVEDRSFLDLILVLPRS